MLRYFYSGIVYLNAEIIILDIFRGFFINMYHWHYFSVKIVIIIINIWQINPYFWGEISLFNVDVK